MSHRYFMNSLQIYHKDNYAAPNKKLDDYQPRGKRDLDEDIVSYVNYEKCEYYSKEQTK